MENLSLNLKVFEIEEEESWTILAENEEQARNYYENEIIDESVKNEMLHDNNTNDIRECYIIKEADKNSEIRIDEDAYLMDMIIKYKQNTNTKNDDEVYLNIYEYVKYIILMNEITKTKTEMPMLLGCSAA